MSGAKKMRPKTNHVVKHTTGKMLGKWDERYAITREHNNGKTSYVFRFCGDVISSHNARDDAVLAAKLHKIGY